MAELDGLRVAILVDNGFEQVELARPKQALEEAGAATSIVSPQEGKVRGWNHTEWGEHVPVDVPLAQARAEEFDALLLPGGVMNPDFLRMKPKAVEFVKAFFDAGKPVAAICHGPWALVEAGVLEGAAFGLEAAGRLEAGALLAQPLRGQLGRERLHLERDLELGRFPEQRREPAVADLARIAADRERLLPALPEAQPVGVQLECRRPERIAHRLDGDTALVSCSGADAHR